MKNAISAPQLAHSIITSGPCLRSEIPNPESTFLVALILKSRA